jgi:nicotinamidase-related amidase
MQNDFVTGSLALRDCPAKQDALELVPIINALRHSLIFDIIVWARDWHPKTHCSFVENVALHVNPSMLQAKSTFKPFDNVALSITGIEQTLWPTHCVQSSWGAELVPGLVVGESDLVVDKGAEEHVDSYSVFWDNGKLRQTNLSAYV